MKEFRSRPCIVCDDVHDRRFMCSPCWSIIWNKFNIGLLDSEPKASESSRDQSIRDMMLDGDSSPEKFYEARIAGALGRI